MAAGVFLLLLLSLAATAGAFQCRPPSSPVVGPTTTAATAAGRRASFLGGAGLVRLDDGRRTLAPSTAASGLRLASSSSSDSASPADDRRPQAFATGTSANPSLLDAIEEAAALALSSLPPASDAHCEVDLAWIWTSSLYEDASSSAEYLAKVVESSSGVYGYAGVRNLVGGTAGGVVGSRPASSSSSSSSSSSRSVRAGFGEGGGVPKECTPNEAEAVPAVTVTLALLPGVELRTFRVDGDDVLEYDGDLTRGGEMAREMWKKSAGLGGFGSSSDDGDDGGKEGAQENEDDDDDAPAFLLLPSPAFQNHLDDFLRGLEFAFPQSAAFGGVASTVSSLSRARIFARSEGGGGGSDGRSSVYGDGCVGVAMKGDLRVDALVAQGAKPVGGVYRVVAAGRGGGGGPRTSSSASAEEDEAMRSTIGAIVLDEAATALEDEAESEEEEAEADDGDVPEDDDEEVRRAKLRAAYAKARIPKPPLAEANFVLRALSDDDRAYMRRALLIGLERGGGGGSGLRGMGGSPGELARLARGEGHRFTVRQVASAGMKDGSVTFPLGSVDVTVGARCRFFVRDGNFAKKEVEALWTGYKKRELEGTLSGGADMGPPTGCLVLPTLDCGSKLFGGKAGYESGLASDFLPGVPSISGFFANGVVGKLDGTVGGASLGGGSADPNMLHGSSSQYVVFRSKSKRPFYSPRKAKEDAANAAALKAEEESAERQLAAEDDKRTLMSKNFGSSDDSAAAAPRSENGELVVRRREVHSGRALSVSTVEWSVAEKTARPTSALEGYMWEKETTVDRQRERVPLAQLMSQTKAAMIDPQKPRPRDWIGAVRRAGEGGNFVIVPECKRMAPVSGSLRKRYDLAKLVKQLTAAGAPAISVNSDGVLFGGALEDITKAREASNSAAVSASLESGVDDGDGVVAPPVLASDLLLYPYQLYKLRLAGADAVTLVVGALEGKDLLYLTKIASTVQLQVVASVTPEVQIEMLNKLGAGSIVALVLSNRDLETFDFDNSGEQALRLLQSEALAAFREKNGEDVPILVEGRVGIVEPGDGNNLSYIQALKDNGAFGVIIGGGMAQVNEEDVAESMVSWSV
ncbi:hypothetical protein ACHAWF_010106 [Thalassiosira exigua]